MIGRRHLLTDAVGFLSGRGMRPRAVVVVGASGIGKTTFLDQLQVEALAAGRTDVIVIDVRGVQGDGTARSIPSVMNHDGTTYTDPRIGRS